VTASANARSSSPIAPAWETRASARFVGLAVARGVSQVLSIAWFLFAARRMPQTEFGVLATSLVFFAVFAGLADAGTSRSVVRYVAADPRTLKSAYRCALGYRVGVGLACTAVVTLLIYLTTSSVSTAAVALAGVCAAISGATELAFAGLRAVGRVNTEIVLLVFERALFLVVAIVVIERGGGALSILTLYTASNLLSAVISGAVVGRATHCEQRAVGRFMDREAAITAAAFAVLIVTPRISAVLVAVLTTPREVAVFSVGLRPAEALGLFALSVATPLLAIVRNDVANDAHAQADTAVRSITGVVMLAIAPFAVWMAVAPQVLLRFLFGEGRFEGASTVARLVAIVALGLTLRGLTEAILLAREQASCFLAIVAIGAAVNLAAGIPLTLTHGATGAAVAMLAAEVAMLAVVIGTVTSIRTSVVSHLAPVVLVGLVVVAGALIASHSFVVMGAATTIACALAAVLLLPMLRTLEHRHV
jgi:O-antigen/teichoic acid export membrane protein